MTIRAPRKVTGTEWLVVFLINLLVGVIMMLIIAGVGYWMLNDTFPLGYGTYLQITVFGSLVAGLGANKGVSVN